MASKKDKQIKHQVGSLSFWLKPLPKGVFINFLGDDSGKPEPPMVEVEYAGGYKEEQPNHNDPMYQQLMQAYQGERTGKMLRLCVVYGVEKVTDRSGKIQGPQKDDVARIRYIYGDKQSPDEVVWNWMAEQLGDTATGLMNLVLGQTEVTEAGLAEAEEMFQPDGEGAGIQREGS